MHSQDECNYLPHKCIQSRPDDEVNDAVPVLLFQCYV